jgi:tetratricopeptide (TPR) repeat protein
MLCNLSLIVISKRIFCAKVRHCRVESRKWEAGMDDAQKSQVGLHVGGNVGGNIVTGDNNVINYYPIIEKNTEKHEPDYWALKHPYPMPPNFTGRVVERAMLTHWLKEDAANRLFILRALGGFGKSALSWHWLTHDVDEKEFPKVLWWSYYEGDASFEHFVEETLKYLNCDAPQGKRAQVDELLKAMQGQRILLIIDGFERTLRAYSSMGAAYQGDEEPKLEDNQLDCTDINAEIFLRGVCSLPKMQGKVLMTTRLMPRAVKPRGECLQGCHEKELQEMDKADAVAFFHAQGIKGARTEIEPACAPYGYHPLGLRILAGFITNDRENPNDIKVAEKLDVTDDLIQNKNHVLKVAYDALSSSQQKLLSNIACLRSPTSYQVLKYISSKPSWKRKNKHRIMENLDSSLQALEARGLLTWDRITNKYDLHPIVRRYAYVRLTATDRVGAHERLVDYFEAVPKPAKVGKLEDIAPVIELYHHLVRAGNLDEAWKLFCERLSPNPLYFQFGAYQLISELLRALFLDGEGKPPRLKDESAQALTLNALATSYSRSGQPRRAVPLFEMNLAIREKHGKKDSIATVLGNMAEQQLVIGTLKDAEHNPRRRINISLEIEDEHSEAIGHEQLGLTLLHCGKWDIAEQELII